MSDQSPLGSSPRSRAGSPPPCGEGSGVGVATLGGSPSSDPSAPPLTLTPPRHMRRRVVDTREGASARDCGRRPDRSQRTLTFTFDGREYRGHPGDTLASALLANGVHLVGRSFKYHRPRGILTAGPEEPNALVELREGARREPNTRATTAELYDGLIAASQNRWPSLRFDLLAINSVLAPILSAGFYYKTFMWPASFWEKVYEPLIRRAAGLGRAAGAADPDSYEKAFLHCDVLVVGGGAGGADGGAGGGPGRRARRAVRAGLPPRRPADRRRPRARRAQLGRLGRATSRPSCAALPDVRILPRTTVFGVYDHGTYAALERVNDHVAVPPEHEPRQRFWRIHAKRCVVAAGAIERPLVFGDNDRPGIMLAGAVRTYLNRYAVAPGRRAVVFATNDETARTVADLARAGIAVAAVVDPRPRVPGSIEAAAKAAGARLIAGGAVTRAHGSLHVRAVDVRTAAGSDGADRLRSRVRLGRLEPVGAPDLASGRAARLERSPRGLRARHAAGRHGRRRRGQRRAGPGGRPGRRCRSRPAGGGRLRRERPARRHPRSRPGEHRAHAAVARARRARQGVRRFPERRHRRRRGARRPRGLPLGRAPQALHHARHGHRPGQDLQRHRPGADGGVHGQAPSRRPAPPRSGRPTRRSRSGRLRARTAARTSSRRACRRRTAGRRSRAPCSSRPGHWLRAQWYPRPGETDWLATVNREVRTVRSSVGVCDVSTLGKIDVQGADAAEFLDRVYTNSWKSLASGQGALRPDAARGRDGAGRRHHLAPRRPIASSSPPPPPTRPRCCSTWSSATSGCGRSSTCRSARSASSGRSIPSPARARAMCCARSSTASTTSPTRLSRTWRLPS